MTTTWKQNQPSTASFNPAQDSVHSSSGIAAVDFPAHHVSSPADQATISKGITFTGEITGTDSLIVYGKIEGRVNLPGSRVTVGRCGQVIANIAASEIVIQGKVRGNVSATDRVEIRADGALTGDVATARISIEDGAFFKGGIDIRKSEKRVMLEAASEQPKSALA